LAALLSRTDQQSRITLASDDAERLTEIGWETWRFFDDLLSPENHYLIPDNIQLVPNEVVARRTSPTNISLSMLSVVAASDLGFTTVPAALSRLQAIVLSLGKLERFNGHFLNWYNTENLHTLAPRYVSTVDSGNLVGHFIALRVALQQLTRQEPLTRQHYLHLRRVIRCALAKDAAREELPQTVRETLTTLDQRIEDGPAWRELIPTLHQLKADSLQLWQSQDRLVSGVTRFVDELLEAEQRIVLGDTLRLCGADQQLCQELYETLSSYIEEIDFLFLFDPARKLFSIGFNVDIGKRDAGYYDLLASEARLASLVAIAKGQVDEEHWFMLGRS
jgi:cyclic beta-1,2-glucan synthetase